MRCPGRGFLALWCNVGHIDLGGVSGVDGVARHSLDSGLQRSQHAGFERVRDCVTACLESHLVDIRERVVDQDGEGFSSTWPVACLLVLWRGCVGVVRDRQIGRFEEFYETLSYYPFRIVANAPRGPTNTSLRVGWLGDSERSASQCQMRVEPGVPETVLQQIARLEASRSRRHIPATKQVAR